MNLDIIILTIVIICIILFIASKKNETFNNTLIQVNKLEPNYLQENDLIIDEFVKSTLKDPSFIKKIENQKKFGLEDKIRKNAKLINDQALKNKIKLEEISLEISNYINFNKTDCAIKSN